MELQDLINMGRSLAWAYEAESRGYYFKDYHYDCAMMAGESTRRKTEELVKIMNHPGVREEMENCPLLANAGYLSNASNGIENRYFDELYDLFYGYASVEDDWNTYFARNRQRIEQVWRKSETQNADAGILSHLENVRKICTADFKQRKFEINLAEAREAVREPVRPAPCFAKTRANGLNCNRSELVEIYKFPVFSSKDDAGRTGQTLVYQVTIEKCTQCRQLYQQIFETAAGKNAGEQARGGKYRSRFLKPGELDTNLGFYFSAREAEKYRQTDLAALTHPLLAKDEIKNYPLDPAQAGNVYEIIEREKTSVSIENLIAVLAKLLKRFDISAIRQTLPDEKFQNNVNREPYLRTEIIGNPQGAHLKYESARLSEISHGQMRAYALLQTCRLVNPQTGRELHLFAERRSIDSEREPLCVLLSGGQSDVEYVKAEILALIEFNNEQSKLLKPTVVIGRQSFIDDNVVELSVIFHRCYAPMEQIGEMHCFFHVPNFWIFKGVLEYDRQMELLYFMQKRFVDPGKTSQDRYYLSTVKEMKFHSPGALARQQNPQIFIARENGLIEAFKTPQWSR